MKKLFILFLFVLTIGIVGLNSVEAEAGAEFYLAEVYTPRFSYLEDADGDLIPLSVHFEFYGDPLETSYNIRLEQVDYQGNYIKLLSSNDYTPTTIGLHEHLVVVEDFTKVRFRNGMDIAFWRMTYNNIVVYSGAVMRRPEYENIDGNDLQIEDYVYNDGGLPDITEHEQYTVMEDSYFIIHYRFDSDWASTPANDLDFIIHDLSTGVFVDAFTPSDILGAILYNDDLITGEYATEARNSFVLVSIDGEIPPFAVTDFDLANDGYLTYTDLDAGVYQISLRNDSGNWVDSAATPLNVARDDYRIFEIKMSALYYELGDDLIVTFLRNNVKANDAYGTFIAEDSEYGTFSVSDIDTFVTDRSIYYEMPDTLLAGDTATVTWQLLINSPAYGTPDVTYYKIQVEDSYSIIESPNFEGKINNLLAAYNWNNDSGIMLVVFVIFLAVNVFLILLKAPLSAYIILNTLTLLFVVFIGFVSAWFSVIIGIILLVGLLRIMRSDG